MEIHFLSEVLVAVTVVVNFIDLCAGIVQFVKASIFY